MFCKKCGHKNEVNAKYCSLCGKKFSNNKNNSLLYIFIGLTGLVLLILLTYNFIQKFNGDLNGTASKPVATTTIKETTESAVTSQATTVSFKWYF